MILTPKGANMNIWFATTEMSDEQKLQNLQSLIDGLGNVIPRGVANVKAIYLQVNQHFFPKFWSIFRFKISQKVSKIFDIRHY